MEHPGIELSGPPVSSDGGGPNRGEREDISPRLNEDYNSCELPAGRLGVNLNSGRFLSGPSPSSLLTSPAEASFKLGRNREWPACIHNKHDQGG